MACFTRVHPHSWQPKDLQRRVSEATQKGISTEVREKEEIVYDIEVEDNHNFFADGILVSNCDEMNFIPNDEDLYDAILFTLGTTNGKFFCTSTPWTTDSVFSRFSMTKRSGISGQAMLVGRRR
ncbi:MAG: hypothetical protein U9O89_07170 [Thermoproteota archaeon]|nr:hypothetical protein [Thermoproteota archaeon]